MLISTVRSLFSDGCPATHAFPYLNGSYCCKFSEERDHSAPQNEIDDGTCDGKNFHLKSRCCKDDHFVKCPDPNGCARGKFSCHPFENRQK